MDKVGHYGCGILWIKWDTTIDKIGLLVSTNLDKMDKNGFNGLLYCIILINLLSEYFLQFRKQEDTSILCMSEKF